MQLGDAEGELLKTWIIAKLEDISDAEQFDSDILADFVLALVKTDDAEPVAKQNCIQELRDFLGDKSKSFANLVFSAIASGEYDPSRPRPPKQQVARPNQAIPRSGLSLPKSGKESRKRGYRDWDRDESQDTWQDGLDAGGRPHKQNRRGRKALEQRAQRQTTSSAPTQPVFGQTRFRPPTPPPGVPPFDPDNPMAFFLAMESFMQSMTGMPDLNRPSHTQRCIEYDTVGFCAKGASCPYEHGAEALVSGDEYDPSQAHPMNVQTGKAEFTNGSLRGHEGYKGRSLGRSGPKRSNFPHVGNQHNRSNTTVVVEQIPAEHFDEKDVRSFFGEFGNISSIEMQAYKRVAVIKYDSHDAAQAAYSSPKAVFGNRFVKVYWHKSARVPSEPVDAEMLDEEAPIDLEEFAKRQAELKERQDARKKELQAAAEKRAALDFELKAVEAERQDILGKLAILTGDEPTNEPVQDGAEESEQTKELREMLAKLEAEAKSLGIDPEAVTDGFDPPNYRGRGAFRGRPRGRAYYRGLRGSRQGGAVMRLDNRTKTIAATFVDGSYEDHDETLRQWLLFNASDSAQLGKHPDRPDIALVTFPERYLGEIFMASAHAPNFALAGKIKLSWFNPNSSSGSKPVIVKPDSVNTAPEEAEENAYDTTRDLDVYDVADEDEDRWG